jgi:hypothetical protein
MGGKMVVSLPRFGGAFLLQHLPPIVFLFTQPLLINEQREHLLEDIRPINYYYE